MKNNSICNLKLASQMEGWVGWVVVDPDFAFFWDCINIYHEEGSNNTYKISVLYRREWGGFSPRRPRSYMGKRGYFFTVIPVPSAVLHKSLRIP